MPYLLVVTFEPLTDQFCLQ